MNEKIKITIIIPVLNAGKTLQATINSLKKQKYSNFEVIVMDGLSKDNTIDIVNNNSDIITTLISEKDESGASACNKAISLSTGDIIMFLYGDDYLDDNALSLIAEVALSQPNYNIISYGLSIEHLDNKKIIMQSYKKKNIKLTLDNILFKHVLNHCYRTKIFKKHGLLKPLYYDKTTFYSNDREFLIRLAISNENNYVIEKILYNMTFHNNSYTGSRLNLVKIREEHIGIADYYLEDVSLSKYKIKKLVNFKSHNLALLLVWYFYKLDFIKFIHIFKKGFCLKGYIWFIDIIKCPIAELTYRASVKKWI